MSAEPTTGHTPGRVLIESFHPFKSGCALTVVIPGATVAQARQIGDALVTAFDHAPTLKAERDAAVADCDELAVIVRRQQGDIDDLVSALESITALEPGHDLDLTIGRLLRVRADARALLARLGKD